MEYIPDIIQTILLGYLVWKAEQSPPAPDPPQAPDLRSAVREDLVAHVKDGRGSPLDFPNSTKGNLSGRERLRLRLAQKAAQQEVK